MATIFLYITLSKLLLMLHEIKFYEFIVQIKIKIARIDTAILISLNIFLFPSRKFDLFDLLINEIIKIEMRVDLTMLQMLQAERIFAWIYMMLAES